MLIKELKENAMVPHGSVVKTSILETWNVVFIIQRSGVLTLARLNLDYVVLSKTDLNHRYILLRKTKVHICIWCHLSSRALLDMFQILLEQSQ